MANIDTYINKLKDFEGLQDKIKKAILGKQGIILGEVKKRLYNQGVDGNLKPMGTYSKSYREYKNAKGRVSSKVTLRDEGDWYRSMSLMFTDTNRLIIHSSEDRKTGELENMYGEAILFLTNTEAQNIRLTIIDPIVDKYLKELSDLNLDDIII
jgi:hypothetical protein